MAENKAAYIDHLAHPLDSLVLLSEVLNFDFASQGHGRALLRRRRSPPSSGLQAFRDRVVRAERQGRIRRCATSSSTAAAARCANAASSSGSAAEVADQLEEWFTGGACDGFVLAATHMPGAYEDFVRLVVPELQRRGLFHREYAGATLRENLGLARPGRGAWRV